MIELHNVSFTYEQAENPGLENVSLTIKEGECVLLCGKSGCGKTTITRLLNGMIPDFYEGTLSGSVMVNGLNPIRCSMYELSKVVGTVFQNPRTQFYTVNSTSEIAFGCENHGFSPESIEKRVAQVAAELKIETLLDRNIFQLSGGEKQMIAFASIYALNPDIYVLDEPSSNLDFKGIRELKEVLKLLKSQGKTVILAEHRTWYLEELVDRCIFMEQGKIVREYTMEELKRFTVEERMRTGIRPVNLSDFSPVKGKGLDAGQSLLMKNIQFAYKKHIALHIADAAFCAGRIVAVIGNNGAGKSTFVSVLSGILKNQKGAVEMEQCKLSPKKRLLYSYMVMQEVNHQLFTDSVEEEVLLGVKNPSLNQFQRVLEQMDIVDLKKRHPMTLSGGQKQRVAIASAVFCGKKILIFDEPTSGLDFYHMMQTAELIKELRKPDIFIFVITHDYEFILTACEEVIQMENGKLKEQYCLDEEGISKLQKFFYLI